jgi:hypothetical protein
LHPALHSGPGAQICYESGVQRVRRNVFVSPRQRRLFVRLCVPSRLKVAVGKGELHRSTGCRDHRLAKIVAAEMVDRQAVGKNDGMNTYFHSAPLPLMPGSVILPGNWGRLLSLYRRGAIGDPWLLGADMTFETIRLKEFPNLPSRLAAAFVFDSLDHANNHMYSITPTNCLYRVELVDPNAATHRGCMNQIKVPGDGIAMLPELIRKARVYWSAKEIEVPEVITLSPLRIVELVMAPAAVYQP